MSGRDQTVFRRERAALGLDAAAADAGRASAAGGAAARVAVRHGLSISLQLRRPRAAGQLPDARRGHAPHADGRQVAGEASAEAIARRGWRPNVRRRCTPRCTRAYAQAEGKARWGEKTPRNGFWIDEIRSLFPDAQFIHIVRDGRDQAIDISDSLLWPNSVYSGAELVAALRECHPGFGVPAAGGCLVRDTLRGSLRGDRAGGAQAVRFSRRGVRPSHAVAARNALGEEWSAHPLHAKTAQPISTRYCEMYRTRLPAADVAALEALIGGTLRTFGYPLSAAARRSAPRLAAQILESDSVTNPENVAYQTLARRTPQGTQGAGRLADADRDSLLWSMN